MRNWGEIRSREGGVWMGRTREENELFFRENQPEKNERKSGNLRRQASRETLRRH